MKKLMNLLGAAFFLASSMTAQGATFGYSPSIAGQPLIFHFDLSEIDPGQYSAATWAQLQNALLIRSSYLHHLDGFHYHDQSCCSPCNSFGSNWNFWVDGMGQWQQQQCEGHNQEFGFHDTTGGVTVGADTTFNNFVFGIAGSYTYTDLHWKHALGECQINSYYGGLYGSWNNGCYYIDASLLAAGSDFDTSRHMHYRRVDRHAKADHHSWETLAGVEAGLFFNNCCYCIDFVPYARIDYVYLSQQGFREHGARSLDLAVRCRSDQLLQSELGLQFTPHMLFEWCNYCWTLAPNLGVSYINQSALSGRHYDVYYIGSDEPFRVKGWNFDRNLGAVTCGFDLNCSQCLTFTAYYDGQFGKNYWNQAVHLICNFAY